MHGRFARYTYTGDIHEIAQKAEQGLLPIFQSQPGFKAYTVSESDGEIFSMSAWESAEAAEAANAAAADWVAENLADELQLIESRFGEIMFSTTLGITTAATARA
jgi:heme-degrading monooxygenase HmoA